MHLEGCHLCKSPHPIDAMTVDMMCREITDKFNGVFDMVIYAAKRTEDTDGEGKTDTKTNTIEYDEYPMQIDFKVTEDPPTTQLVSSSINIYSSERCTYDLKLQLNTYWNI